MRRHELVILARIPTTAPWPPWPQTSRRERLRSPVILPYDDQLAAMLDSATYTLEALERPTRLAIKRAGLVAVERLV